MHMSVGGGWVRGGGGWGGGGWGLDVLASQEMLNLTEYLSYA